MICCWSASTSKVDIEDLSSGITCFLFHVPQANWKKFVHGSAAVSMAMSKDEAVRTHSSVRQMFFLGAGEGKEDRQTEMY